MIILMMLKMKPRNKNRIQNTDTLKECYKFYKQNLKYKNTPLNVSYSLYRNICVDFNKEISKKILYEAFEFKVPYKLGKLRIKKFKMTLSKKKLRIDFNATKKYGKTIYHLNDHSDNFAYRWFWDKSSILSVGKRTYSFEATRANKRAISPIIKNKEQLLIDYFE